MNPTSDTFTNDVKINSLIFNTKTGIITKNDNQEIFLENRLRDILLILLANKNSFVSKNELLEFAWTDTIVSDQSVPKAISDLRKVLSTHQINDIKITTVRKLGYRLEIQQQAVVRQKLASTTQMSVGIAILALLLFILIHH